ncbi:hypothetical protein [Streptomyces sp. NPDC059881]|uniref:hypothetical protein n=1 Tax=Streptomyces sp. NPDC059881 TaxID=3346986 RepID=UPI00365D6A3E
MNITNRLCVEFGMRAGHRILDSDAMSDAQIFVAMTVAVAVNADHHLSGLAAHTWTGSDLPEAYNWGDFNVSFGYGAYHRDPSPGRAHGHEGNAA